MSFLFTLLTVCLLSASDVSAALTDNQSSYQTAFLYFLPDYEPKQVDEAEVRGCAKIGYTVTRSNCEAPRILKDKCPVGNVYKTCYCAGSPTCTGSTSATNPYPSSAGASSTNCVNCSGNRLYTWSCSGCEAYTLSSCPSHGNCSQCCNGKYKLNSCSSGYSVSGNSCEEDCNSSSSNWCPVHHLCHVNCCTDGSIDSCDTRCGGSGCEPACTPLADETGCSNGTESCSDGCGGMTRKCCKATPSSGCNSDEYYRNMDGTYTVQSYQKSINLYGAYNTTNIPAAGIKTCYAGWTYWSNATIQGGPLETSELVIGIHGGTMHSNVVFNVPVTVNGTIYIFKNSSITFNKGLSGNYTCRCGTGSGYATAPCSCPF